MVLDIGSTYIRTASQTFEYLLCETSYGHALECLQSARPFTKMGKPFFLYGNTCV